MRVGGFARCRLGLPRVGHLATVGHRDDRDREYDQDSDPEQPIVHAPDSGRGAQGRHS